MKDRQELLDLETPGNGLHLLVLAGVVRIQIWFKTLSIS